MLSKKQLIDVCLINDGTYKRCRYLCDDGEDASKHYCAKLTSSRKLIDRDVDDFVHESLKRGKDPRVDNVPLGDNCKGYPVTRNIEQGYDKP